MTKTVKLIILCSAIACFAVIGLFSFNDSTPKLSSTSEETGLQSVETIMKTLSKGKAKDFSSAIESIDAGIDLFLKTRDDGIIESNASAMMADLQEKIAFRPIYTDKFWKKLNGQSVNQLISLGKAVDAWGVNMGNCAQSVIARLLLESENRIKIVEHDKLKKFIAHQEYVAKECYARNSALGMPDIYQDN